jgi:hypothetical protein
MDVMRLIPFPADTRCAVTTVIDSPSMFESGACLFDADTHEGLRTALHAVAVHGWDCPAGAAVVAALTYRCAKKRRRWVSGGGFLAERTDPGSELSVAWCTLNRFASNVAAAEAPWAYLWTATRNALAMEASAAAMLSEQATRRTRDKWPVAVRRIGDDAMLTARAAGLDGTTATDPTDGDGMSATTAAVVAHLAGDDAEEAAFWADAVGRALDVMAAARRSYEEYDLRRDAYASEVLSLRQDELAALAALLIGPRRGDRAAHSLLLALHRDPSARPEDVTGAVARIAFLRSRRHTVALPGRRRVA